MGMTYKPTWKTFFELGKEDFYESNYNSAIRYFSSALLNNPQKKKYNYCYIYIYCACSHYFLGNNITSINYFRNGLIEDKSTSRLPLWLLINNLLEKSDFNNLKDLNNLLKISQKLFTKYGEKYIGSDEMMHLYWMQACIYKNLKQNRLSLTYYSKAISFVDGEKFNYEKRFWLISLLSSRSKVYINKGDYKKAIYEINEAKYILGDDPFYGIYLNAGVVYKELQNYNISISMFSKAIDNFEDFNPWKSSIIFAYINRGYLRIKIGNIEEGINDFELAYNLDNFCMKKYKEITKKIPKGVKTIMRINSQIKI